MVHPNPNPFRGHQLWRRAAHDGFAAQAQAHSRLRERPARLPLPGQGGRGSAAGPADPADLQSGQPNPCGRRPVRLSPALHGMIILRVEYAERGK